MSELPAHASPLLAPASTEQGPAHLITQNQDYHDYGHGHEPDRSRAKTPPPILTPSLTPPHSEFFSSTDTELQPSATESQAEQPIPRLVDVLPTVTCEVRARIPTTVGQEMWLHLYHNDTDDKEHLAIVFGPSIRSKSLDAPRPGETEKDRMIRGAYTGRLYPGRTDSRVPSPTGRYPEAGPSSKNTTSTERLGNAVSTTARSAVPDNTRKGVTQKAAAAPLVRIHSECYTGETVWSARCDCGEQLDQAARLMSENTTTAATDSSFSTDDYSSRTATISSTAAATTAAGGGVIIYLRQEGRGIGLLSKLKAYNLQDLGHDTVMANLLLRHPADARSYGLATAMLLDLGLGGDRGIRLLTNNPDKVRAVEGPGREITVVERVPMIPLSWTTGGAEGVKGPEIERYISTKIEKFKHMFSA